jgi:hypothetical protein
MPHYKDQENKVHWLDSDEFANLLPVGSVEITDVEAEELRIPPAVSTTLLDYDIAVERELDRQAEEAGYYDPLGRIPNIDRACSYAGHFNQYQAEGQSFVAWRAEVWEYVYQVKSDVESGNRAQPTIADLIAELPQR